MKTLEEVRKVFEGDRFATENGAVIDEVGEDFAVCSLEIKDGHKNAAGAESKLTMKETIEKIIEELGK